MITTKYMENKTMSNSKFWRYPPTLLTELYEVILRMKEVYIAAMHSISILASNGNAATWYVERAGAGEGKSAKQTI